MYTSSFFKIPGDAPGRISIARFFPRNQSGFRVYKALAPGTWFNSVSEERYRELFFGEILGPLDAGRVWDDLHKLAGDAEPVLLCWEKLEKPGEWCHRRMVAEWFESELGIVVPEWSGPTKRKAPEPSLDL